MWCSQQPHVTEDTVKNSDIRPRYRDIQPAITLPLTMLQISEHPQLFASVRRVDIVRCLCFTESEFTGLRQHSPGVRSQTSNLGRLWKSVPTSALGQRTIT